jgi:hypothetical protein
MSFDETPYDVYNMRGHQFSDIVKKILSLDNKTITKKHNILTYH